MVDNWFSDIQPVMIILFLMLFVFSVIYFTAYYSKYFLPEPASQHGAHIVPVYRTTFVLTGIVFFITQVLLFVFAFRYKASKGRKAQYVTQLGKIELYWTIIPLITFIGLFIWGQFIWDRVNTHPEKDVLDIEIMAEQFNWRVRYPGKDRILGKFNTNFMDENNDMGLDFKDPHNSDDFMPVQLHIPKNRTVRLVIRSRDVIHSVFIPHLRFKMDAVPGMLTHFHLTPTISTREMRQRVGNPYFNYELACAELCGRMHYGMKLIVVVDDPEDFDEWYQNQKSWLSLHPEYKSKELSHFISK
jgi:cytochrome c oxidase subunit 2